MSKMNNFRGYPVIVSRDVQSKELDSCTPVKGAGELSTEWPGAGTVSKPVAHSDLLLSDRAKDLRQMAAGAGIALGGKLVGRGVRLVGDIVLAHILGPASFGLYAIGWTITKILSMLTPLGLDAGVVRFASPSWGHDHGRVKGAISQSLRFSVISGLLMGVGFFLLAPWLGEDVFHQPSLVMVFRCFAFALPLVTGLKVAAAATRVSQRMKFSAYAEDIGQPAVALLLIVVLYFFGWKLGGAIAAFVLSFGFGLILAIYYIRKLFPEVVSKSIKPVLEGRKLVLFSLPASLSVMFGILLLWIDRLFVGYYCPAKDVGIYHAASQLPVALGVILSGFGAIVGPMIAGLYHRGKKERLEELYRVSTKWAFYLSLPPFLVMCFAPRDAVSVIFGKPYALGGMLLPVLGIGQLINSGTGPVGALLVMTGHQNELSILSGIVFLTNIGFAVLLVPRFGIFGAALGTTFSVGLLCLVSVFVARRLLRLWPYDWRYLKGLVATGAASAALVLFRQLPVALPYLVLTGAAAISIIVFVAVLVLLGLEVEDREFLHMILTRALRQQRG